MAPGKGKGECSPSALHHGGIKIIEPQGQNCVRASYVHRECAPVQWEHQVRFTRNARPVQ